MTANLDTLMQMTTEELVALYHAKNKEHYDWMVSLNIAKVTAADLETFEKKQMEMGIFDISDALGYRGYWYEEN